MTPDVQPGDRTNPQLLNRYAYVGNDPINYRDPSGTFLVGFEYCMYVDMGDQLFYGNGVHFPPDWGAGPFLCDAILILPSLNLLAGLHPLWDPTACSKVNMNNQPKCDACCRAALLTDLLFCFTAGLLDPVLGEFCGEQAFEVYAECGECCDQVIHTGKPCSLPKEGTARVNALTAGQGPLAPPAFRRPSAILSGRGDRLFSPAPESRLACSLGGG